MNRPIETDVLSGFEQLWLQSSELVKEAISLFYLLDENYCHIWTQNSNNRIKVPRLSMLFNQNKFGNKIWTERQGTGTSDAAAVRRLRRH